MLHLKILINIKGQKNRFLNNKFMFKRTFQYKIILNKFKMDPEKAW